MDTGEKFRVWDEKRKKWVTDFLINKFGFVICSNGSMFYDYVHETNVIVLRNTGMIDKNGIQIWEGDLVETTAATEYSQNDLVYEEVTFHAGAFYPICLQPNETWRVVGNIYNNDDLIGICRNPVIGNIYENTKLLGTEQGAKPWDIMEGDSITGVTIIKTNIEQEATKDKP